MLPAMTWSMMEGSMKRTLVPLLAACILIATLAPAAGAAVNVQRTGSENPMQEVFKSVIYGGLAGIVLGSAIALADKGNDNDGDIMRWSFVGGTFLGLGFGIYHVTSRPSAMLELDQGRLRLAAPAPTFAPRTGVRLAL